MALAAAPDVPGFRALSPLGYGPTSTLYSAQSVALGRWVALTVYSTALADDRAQRRFSRAFETARRLGSHPHAVTMLECGLTLDRRPYVATEIYERGTLDGRVAGRKPLKIDEALHMAIAVAGALETAHRADVIHGGVHPARVLVGSDGQPALSDLGLVPLVERGGLAALVGPMSYHAAPEVLEGEPVTPATDVYSLASTLYTVLTGRPPYRGDDEDDTVASLLLRILQHAVPPIDGEDVPQSLEWVVHQALSCEPKDRPERPLAFAQALQACQQELQLPVTQPVVLDIAANLRLASGDDLSGPLEDNGYHAGSPAVSDDYDSPARRPLRVEPPTPTPAPAPAGGTVQRVFVPYPTPEPEPEPPDGPGTDVGGGFDSRPGLTPDRADVADAPAALVDEPGRSGGPAFTVPVATTPPAIAPLPELPASRPSPLFPPAGSPTSGPMSATPMSGFPAPDVDEPPTAYAGPMPEAPATSTSLADPFAPAGPVEDGTRAGDGSSPWPDLPLDPPLAPGSFDQYDRGHGRGRGRGPDQGHDDEPSSESDPATPTARSTVTRPPESTPMPAGPRALPVLVLMGLVAVLIAGVSWMIITGEDPSQEEPAGSSSTSRAIDGSGSGSEEGSGSQSAATTGGEVTATENASGVQLDWEESASGNQVVLILSVTEAPRALPVETGTALLVPSETLQPQTGYCFAVIPAGDTIDPTQLANRLPTRAIPPTACIRGATDATVRRE